MSLVTYSIIPFVWNSQTSNTEDNVIYIRIHTCIAKYKENRMECLENWDIIEFYWDITDIKH